VAVLLLGVLVFRLPAVARAVLMLREVSLAGTLAQLLGIVGEDLRPALLVALPAGIAITLLAGRGRRDPGLDIELGAACSIPYLLLSGLAELAGSQLPGAARGAGLGDSRHRVGLGDCGFRLGVRLARGRPFQAKLAAAGEPVALAPERRSRPGACAWLPRSWAGSSPGRSPSMSSGSVTTTTPSRRSAAGFAPPLSCFHASTESQATWRLPSCEARSSCSISGSLVVRHALRSHLRSTTSTGCAAVARCGVLAISAEGSIADRAEIQAFVRQLPAPIRISSDEPGGGGPVPGGLVASLGNNRPRRSHSQSHGRAAGRAEIDAAIQQALDD